MKEYDVYAPLYSNRGVRFPVKKLTRLKKRLIKRFGGLTYFPQKTEGFWKIGKVVFRDEIVILRVLCDEHESLGRFWGRLKQDLRREWGQRDVLIVVREVVMV